MIFIRLKKWVLLFLLIMVAYEKKAHTPDDRTTVDEETPSVIDREKLRELTKEYETQIQKLTKEEKNLLENIFITIFQEGDGLKRASFASKRLDSQNKHIIDSFIVSLERTLKIIKWIQKEKTQYKKLKQKLKIKTIRTE